MSGYLKFYIIITIHCLTSLIYQSCFKENTELKIADILYFNYVNED